MNHQFRNRAAGTALFFLALMLPGSVSVLSAQTAEGDAAVAADAPASTGEVRTVVVQASRGQDDSDRVAAQVTVITSSDIRESGALTIQEVLEDLGGLGFTGTGSSVEAQVAVRGFGENGFGRVLVLVDGVRVNNPDMKGIDWGSILPASVERIEIIRGPACALYGDSALAAVILVTTRKGGRDLAVDAGASLGMYLAHQEHVQVSAGGDGYSWRVGARDAGSQGWRDRSAWESVGADGGLSVDLADTLTMDLSVGGNGKYYQMPGAISLSQFGADPAVAANQDDEALDWGARANLGLVWNPVEGLELSLPASGRYVQVRSDMVSWSQWQTRNTQAVELRPQASWDIKGDGLFLTLRGGLDGRYNTLDWTNYSDASRTSSSGDRSISQLSGAPWMQGRIGLGDMVWVEAAGRYDMAAWDLNGASRTVQALAGRLALDVVPARGLKFWVGADRVFRYPFTDEMASVSTTTVWDLEPETGWNFGAGMAWSLPGGLLDLEASAYALFMENEIAWVDDYGNAVDYGYNTNLDDTRHLGFDIHLSGKPLDWLRARADYSFTDARYTSGSNEGEELSLVPAHRAGASVDFLLPAGISFGPAVAWVSDWYASGYQSYGSTSGGTGKEPGWFLVDARVDWKLPLEGQDVTLRLRGKNLLNVMYYTWGSSWGVYPGDGISADVILDWTF